MNTAGPIVNDVNIPLYDVLIIGGGLSGMTSAALLSRLGYKTAVLESEAVPGGYLAGFQRKGFHFDSSIHWLNQCGPDGYVSRILRAVGEDHPPCPEIKKIRRFKTSKHRFLLTSNPDVLQKELLDVFPHERKGIQRFFGDARKIAAAFKKHSTSFRSMQTANLFQKGLWGIKKLFQGFILVRFVMYSGEKGIKRGLDRYFLDPDLRALWSTETDLLSCIVPIAWAYNHDYQSPPKGGGHSIIHWLEERLRSYGGEIFCNTKVTRIINKGKKADFVIAQQNGKEIRYSGRYIIAACDVQTLYEQMLSPEVTNINFIKKLHEAELYTSAITLNIGLDCPPDNLGFGQEMLIISEPGLTRKDHGSGLPETASLSIFSPSMRDASMAPEGKGTLTIYSQTFFDLFEQWGTEKDENGEIVREEKYREIKKGFADSLINRVEKNLNIDLHSHIEFMDIATPITYHRYTGNREGVSMGARPGKNNYQARIGHYQTPLKNVLLSGHWATLGGGVPIAAATAISSTLLLLRKENKADYRDLSRYCDGKITPEQWDAGTKFPE